MASWLGQCCINVTDLERSVAFYTALGLENTSRTEIPQALEAIVEHPAGGSKLQLAQQKEPAEPFDLGTGLWKLYVNTHDIASTYDAALAAGAQVQAEPQRLEQWPVTIAFVLDPDGYLVEIVERHPWPDDAPAGAPWLGQYCLNVTDIDATLAFYEALGLTCTSRTEIPHAFEGILEQPGKGGKLQLAQQKDQPVRSGWARCGSSTSTPTTARPSTRRPSTAATRRSSRPCSSIAGTTTIAFVGDPDGYQVELVQRHPD